MTATNLPLRKSPNVLLVTSDFSLKKRTPSYFDSCFDFPIGIQGLIDPAAKVSEMLYSSYRFII